MQEVVASAILVGAVIGGVFCGWFSDRYGRRTAIIIIAAIFAMGAVAASLAPSAVMLALARVFLGVATGASSQLAARNIALASKHRMDDARGALGRVRPEGADLDAELKGIESVTRKTEESDICGWLGYGRHGFGRRRPAALASRRSRTSAGSR
jgi:hypothetical protein